uniref:Uncharacterized protein n=1 Tax=Larimichthys crocea TaxID=215358 RepID=A0A0F8C2F0_LARCR
MSSDNNDMDMYQGPPRVSAEKMQPLVDFLLAQLTSGQWAKLTSGTIDDQTRAVITEICVDFMNAVTKIVLEAFENHLAQAKSKSRLLSLEMICEEEVQKYLGTSITDAFASVTGRPVSRTSARKLSDLVSEEIIERINSPPTVSRIGRESKTTGRLQIIVKHVISMLKNCKAKMSCASTTRSVDSQSPLIPSAERTSPAEQESLREQTPVSLIGPEDRRSVGSFIDTTTEAVKEILLEKVSDPEVKFNADISEEEHLQIVNSIKEDADEAACEIAQYIWSNREELGLNKDGTPIPEAQSSSLNCWNVVANKIKILFARKFAKEAIASLIVKLSTRLSCKKAPLDVLIPAADKVVEDMIPENTDECTFEAMAICINNGQHEEHSVKLGHIIFEHLQRALGGSKVTLVMIQMEVKKFMTMLRKWLNRQTQKLTKKNNRVDDSLKRIRESLDLPEPTEDTVTPVESAEPSPTAESGVSNDVDICTTPIHQLRPPSITDEPGYVDICTIPVPEFRAPSITDKPGVGDERKSVTPVRDRSPSITEEDDDYTPMFGSVTPRVTYVPAVSGRTQPTADMYKEWMVTAVVRQCLKNVRQETNKEIRIASALIDMMPTFPVDFQPTGNEIKQTARAVHKTLCAIMGSKGVVARVLLREDSQFYEYLIETLKRQLMKPKKTSVKSFFISLFHTVSKPFQRCQCSMCD